MTWLARLFSFCRIVMLIERQTKDKPTEVNREPGANQKSDSTVVDVHVESRHD